MAAVHDPQTAYKRFLQKLAKQQPGLAARNFAESGQDESDHQVSFCVHAHRAIHIIS